MIRVNNEQRKTHSGPASRICLAEDRWDVNCCLVRYPLLQGGQKCTVKWWVVCHLYLLRTHDVLYAHRENDLRALLHWGMHFDTQAFCIHTLVESLLSRWKIDDAMTQTWYSPSPRCDRTRRCSPIVRRGRTASCLNGLRITWWNRYGKCIE